ncbi:pyruvate dehydrogenase E1 component subunit alpha-like 1 [Homarus americanus]|uniref:Pyruvate dehydrogenase E1 component subunit alpha-like 1 n=1 Tax=Homarus americanus TaxID=6706 RepID=A0A8J5NBD9_HOMAM|nr:pyruvate dehydrogenase E1 component subunit alpha-like 1 [Homarus americanus]
MDCLSFIKQCHDDLTVLCVNYCWRTLWPEVVDDFVGFPKDVQHIVQLARRVGGEGLDDLQEEEADPSIKRSVNLKRGVEKLLLPYKKIMKELKHEVVQPPIIMFFLLTSAREPQPPVSAPPSDSDFDMDDPPAAPSCDQPPLLRQMRSTCNSPDFIFIIITIIIHHIHFDIHQWQGREDRLYTSSLHGMIDGMDMLSVREAIKYCVDYCTSGKGPLVLEVATYRYHGHSMSDPGTSYRTRDEIQEVRQTHFDYIRHIDGTWCLSPYQKIDSEVRKEVDEAVKIAKSDKEIAVQELAADVYSNPLESSIRGTTPFDPYTHQRLSKIINLH